VTANTGLRRFVAGSSGVPAASRPDDGGPAGQAAPTFGAAPSAAEKCGMCVTEIPDEHGHVADLEASSLICACRACYLLFTHAQAGRGRYRAVPDRYLQDRDRPLTVAQWDLFLKKK